MFPWEIPEKVNGTIAARFLTHEENRRSRVFQILRYTRPRQPKNSRTRRILKRVTGVHTSVRFPIIHPTKKLRLNPHRRRRRCRLHNQFIYNTPPPFTRQPVVTATQKEIVSKKREGAGHGGY